MVALNFEAKLLDDVSLSMKPENRCSDTSIFKISYQQGSKAIDVHLLTQIR